MRLGVSVSQRNRGSHRVIAPGRGHRLARPVADRDRPCRL